MLWGGRGERKRERAGHDGKTFSLFPSFLARFFDYCYFIGMPKAGASAEEREFRYSL